MYRKGSYNERVAQNLLSGINARRDYVLADLEEDDFNIIENIKEAINYMGIKEFSELADLQATSVSRFINSDEIPKLSTLEKFFAPFGVKPKISVEPLEYEVA